jgi:hypothetical protein
VQQVRVYWADQGPTVGRHRSEHEETHALQPLAHLLGAEPTITGDDLTQMRAGFGGAAIEKALHPIYLVRRLQHAPISPRGPQRCHGVVHPPSRPLQPR